MSKKKIATHHKDHGPGDDRTDDRGPHEDDDEGDDEEHDDTPQSLKESAKSWLKDIILALVVVMIVISILYVYTGNWPPLVVVESNSMMHGEDSSLGTIDTGDLVFVKSVDTRGDVISYVEGMEKDYKTYSNYGDVIIFKRNEQSGTPIIHRAIVWVEFNGETFDVPSLDKYGVTEISIKYHPFDGHPYNYVSINLTNMYTRAHTSYPEVYPEDGFAGFITRGDNNPDFDQGSIGQITGPVSMDSIVGVARGEVPWFGLIKLKIGGNLKSPTSQAPKTSVRMLIISIAVFITIPFILDYIFIRLEKRKERGREGPGAPPERGEDEDREVKGERPKEEVHKREKKGKGDKGDLLNNKEKG